jgi:hypothetical protein
MNPRPYLNAVQLAEVTPWSVDAIEKMVRRGTLRQGVHCFQPLGRGTQKVFKWTAIVSLIEADTPVAEALPAEDVTGARGGLDVDGAEAALRGLLDRACAQRSAAPPVAQS